MLPPLSFLNMEVETPLVQKYLLRLDMTLLVGNGEM